MASALLDAGVVQFCAHALDAAAAASSPPPDKTLSRLLQIVHAVLMLGESGANAAAQAEGA